MLCGDLPINARMRLVRIDWIQDGMELARDIPSAAVGAAPLLRRGVRLSQSLASRLSSLGIRALWIEDDMGEGIIPAMPLPDHIRTATEEAVAACFEAALAFDDLASADSYTYNHSMRVATLGLLLGQRIDRTDGWVDYRGEVRYDRMVERMTQLTMGLLVHDIGKLAIPEQILNKPGKLSPEEWELIKTHPAAGASLLDSDRISPLTRAVVRDHHERWDGKGYAAGREGEDIHQFARIAAVADVYDAITADRPYQPANPPHVAVKAIREGAGTQFDPTIVAHFLRIAMPYPVGYTITLPDGSSGAVVGVEPEEPEYPVIRYREGAGFVEAALHIVDGVVLTGDTAGAATPEPTPPAA